MSSQVVGAGPRTPYALLLCVLVSLSAAGLFASDVNLPGIPIAAHALGASLSSVQWTFSVFMIGIAFSQAVYGPLSDAYGRKPVIVVGLGLFTVASLLCASSTDIAVFTVGRLLQALGAGAGVVVGRAVISDLYEEKAAAQVFTTIMPIVGISPSVAPLLGGYLTQYVSWRAPFVVTAVIGLATLVTVLAAIPETLPRERRARRLAATIKVYPQLLRTPLFWAYTGNLVVAYGGYFGYLAVSPLLFQRMGLSTAATSYCYITVSVAYVLGNLWSRKLIRTQPVNRLLLRGHAFFLTGALLVLALGLSGAGRPWGLLILLFMPVMTLGNGFLLPLSMSAGVTNFRTVAGSASGLMGALQLSGASLGIFIASRLPQGNLAGLGWFVTIAALLGALLFTFLTRRPATPTATPLTQPTEPERPKAMAS
ncbi:MFS transporter [Kitasatospora sp. MMS16-BH015]|uniref:multidrug effflux MFS transporter n=1 Tax=Kitasatospora sp. MMS16-BH015 TaxID=2018025 RepID=UPI000CA0A196|nr:multidrug effflux MFS transporter [Kitasatospora sp. MMS16-BH015]AUG78460.1 MFS transporter [Kitasatospora sp. MMS16-BH015]